MRDVVRTLVGVASRALVSLRTCPWTSARLLPQTVIQMNSPLVPSSRHWLPPVMAIRLSLVKYLKTSQRRVPVRAVYECERGKER